MGHDDDVTVAHDAVVGVSNWWSSADDHREKPTHGERINPDRVNISFSPGSTLVMHRVSKHIREPAHYVRKRTTNQPNG
jgi:hypothetical protein